ncbi:MAG TPA: CUAEP/CCAEP-tail radical SAM protein [Bryobacteraceae bacterium]|nr:CUAEP/CCAEP-tail radical SAM protein [Bryobacteraceae bacterium]
MNVVLISTYDLGHQPFGLASPAAWLRERGHHVTAVDLAVGTLPSLAIREADAVAFFLPMHTATRLAAEAIAKVRLLNPSARLLAYGLYAPLNAAYLRELGVETIAGGEFERVLADVLGGEPRTAELVSLERLSFRIPDRAGLPNLALYSKLRLNGEARIAGYTEASRGCKHLCRHCPVAPVYQGVFRVVQPEVVIEDVRHQVSAGATHITFGDPDFFNGPGHGMRIVRALHKEFPALTYDVTIKVEHLLKHREYLPELRDTGCLFVTSAVESTDNVILAKFDKGHTRADFLEVSRLFRQLGMVLAPTFVPFTPWTTRKGYQDLLQVIAAEDLIENVASVQLALRLLIPPGSLLLELQDIQACISGYDKAALLYRWSNPNPEMDSLASSILRLVSTEQKRRRSRRDLFALIWEEAHGAPPREEFDLIPRAAIPYMDEPWYC